jgi:hypothetical protein
MKATSSSSVLFLLLEREQTHQGGRVVWIYPAFSCEFAAATTRSKVIVRSGRVAEGVGREESIRVELETEKREK